MQDQNDGRCTVSKMVTDMVKVDLNEIVNAIESNEECYVDLTDGSVRYTSWDEFADTDDNDHDTITLFFEYNVGYSAMEAFISNLDDDRKAGALSRAISGKGAFGKFRAVLDAYDMTDEWYSFKNEYMRQVAKEWCDDKGLKYDP